MSNEITLTIISGVLILLGIAGTILPFLPGPPLALAGLILYGFAVDFDQVSILVIVIFSILTGLTFLIDLFAPALGARGYKASRWGFLGAILGGFLGIFIFGPVGIILGPLIGGFIGEYISLRNTTQALKVATGAFIGFLVGTVIKLAIVFAIAGYFVYLIVK